MSILCCENRAVGNLKAGHDSRGHYSISICQTCGEIKIFAEKDGVSFNFDFHIWGPESIKAIVNNANEELAEKGEKLNIELVKI